MSKIINKLKIRNIQDLYDIHEITQEGQISLEDKNILIYKIDPANIVACSEEAKHRIYQAYMTCIRGLPDNIQILVSREMAHFEEQIRLYNKRLNQIENEKLRLAIKKYVEYLNEISNVNKMYQTNYYLVIQNIKSVEAEEIINIFSNMKEFGIRITLIKSKEEVKKILRRFIVKE